MNISHYKYLYMYLSFSLKMQDAVLKEDQSTKKWLSQLLINLETPVGSNTGNSQQQGPGSVLPSQTQAASPLGMG